MQHVILIIITTDETVTDDIVGPFEDQKAASAYMDETLCQRVNTDWLETIHEELVVNYNNIHDSEDWMEFRIMPLTPPNSEDWMEFRIMPLTPP